MNNSDWPFLNQSIKQEICNYFKICFSHEWFSFSYMQVGESESLCSLFTNHIAQLLEF